MQKRILALMAATISNLLTAPAFAEAASLKLNDFAFGGDLTQGESEFRRFTLSLDMIKTCNDRIWVIFVYSIATTN